MIEGSCHCGIVTWTVLAEPDYATSCNCTLCRRLGAFWAYGFKDDELRVYGPTKTYLRGPRTIGFHFCQNCGCVAYWMTPEPGQDGRYYGAVNLRLAEPDQIADIPVNHFEGHDSSKALARDGRCIGDVLWR